MRYKIEFTGRVINAIGVTGRFTEVVEADNPDDAVLKLYHGYEHIALPSVVETTEPVTMQSAIRVGGILTGVDEAKPGIVFACGGFYPENVPPDKQEFKFVRPSGHAIPYVAETPMHAAKMWRLMQHHAHLYKVDLTSGIATLIERGELGLRNWESRFDRVTIPADLLYEVRAVANSGKFIRA